MKHKKLIVLITAVIFLISSIGIYGKTLFFSHVKGEASTILSFQFDGIDQGLNPHGGTFDIQNVKNSSVLEKTIADLKLEEKGITPEMLSKHIKLKAYVPKDVLTRILPQSGGIGTSALEQVEGMTYHPTQYKVTLTNAKDLKLKEKEAKQIVDTLVANYTEDFISRFKDTQVIVSAAEPIDSNSYDYSEYITLVKGQLDMMYQYLLAKDQEARTFKAETTGVGFGDLLARIELLQDVEIANATALIDTFTITKDQEELVSIYENRISKLLRDKSQIVERKESLKKAVEQYQKDPTIVLENGAVFVGNGETVTDEEEGTLHDRLTSEYILAETEYNSITHNIVYYQELLAKLKNNTQNSAAIKAYKEELDESIAYIEDQMAKISKLTLETADEYFQNDAFKDSVKQAEPVIYKTNFKLSFIKNTFIICVLTGFGLILGMIVALYKEVVPKKTSKNNPSLLGACKALLKDGQALVEQRKK